MDWFKKVLNDNWKISAAGGLTGEAYVAEKGTERLFLKRNSSPFLAVLSAEGIVPKLVWTKRLDNGDVITAQEWREGEKLSPVEMQQDDVTLILQKIHHSSELLHMLMRLGKRPITAEQQLIAVSEHLSLLQLPKKYDELKTLLQYMQQLLPVTTTEKQVVCHGDIDHHNFLRAADGKLYLIDWDNALIGDPTMDYANILHWYIPKEKWGAWLAQYGIEKDVYLPQRMYWYLALDALTYVAWHFERSQWSELEKRLHHVRMLNKEMNNFLPGLS